MSRVRTYLDVKGITEEAFTFYASVFNTSVGESLLRFGDGPPGPDARPSVMLSASS